MEDKWFIYWNDNTLYFHRSWTGMCLYIVHFEAARDGHKIISADINRDPDQYNETSDVRDLKVGAANRIFINGCLDHFS